MGLFGAARMGNRMGARQQYRTMARMQRRRSMLQSSMGMHQDFQSRDEEQPAQESGSYEEAMPDYTSEIKELTKLKNQGILTEEEFSAKKKQLLGI